MQDGFAFLFFDLAKVGFSLGFIATLLVNRRSLLIGFLMGVLETVGFGFMLGGTSDAHAFSFAAALSPCALIPAIIGAGAARVLRKTVDMWKDAKR